MKNIVGIDIGGTNLRIALATENGEILKSSSERTDSRNVMDQIYNKLDGFPEFEGIGIAAAGPLDSNKGVITKPPNMDIKNLAITDILKKKYGKPVYLLNDCVAVVLGEKRFGEGKDVENMVYITFSTGIGCGVIVDNRVIFGKDGNAHEVGHNIIDSDSKLLCGCGAYGHWEAYCGGKNMPNYVRYLLNGEYKDSNTPLKDNQNSITPELLFKLAESDEVASKIVGKIGKINAIGIANIINSYDPELITIGGSVAINNEKRLNEAISSHVAKYSINRLPKISITKLGHDAGIYGAIAGFLYFQEKVSK